MLAWRKLRQKKRFSDYIFLIAKQPLMREYGNKPVVCV